MITWKIEKLYTTDNDIHTDIVTKVDFSVKYTNENGKWCDTKGFRDVSYNSDNFTEYSSLTEEQVINWVKSDLGILKVSALETLVEDEFNKIDNEEISSTTVFKLDSLTKTTKEQDTLPF